MFTRLRTTLALFAAASAPNKNHGGFNLRPDNPVAESEIKAAVDIFRGHTVAYEGHLGSGTFGSILQVRVSPGQPRAGKTLPWRGERVVAVKVARKASSPLFYECAIGSELFDACPHSVLRYYPALRHAVNVTDKKGKTFWAETCVLDLFPAGIVSIETFMSATLDYTVEGKVYARRVAVNRLRTVALLAAGAECIRAAGLYHGDASPANLGVGVGADGAVNRVILFDFDSAGFLGEHPLHGGTPCACGRPREWGDAFRKADDRCTASIDTMAIAQVGAELMDLKPLEPVVASLVLAAEPECFLPTAQFSWGGETFLREKNESHGCYALQRRMKDFLSTSSGMAHVSRTTNWQDREDAVEWSNELCRWNGDVSNTPHLIRMFIPDDVKVEDAVKGRGPIQWSQNPFLLEYLTDTATYSRHRQNIEGCDWPLEAFNERGDEIATTLCHEFIKSIFNLTPSPHHRSMTVGNAAEFVLVKSTRERLKQCANMIAKLDVMWQRLNIIPSVCSEPLLRSPRFASTLQRKRVPRRRRPSLRVGPRVTKWHLAGNVPLYSESDPAPSSQTADGKADSAVTESPPVGPSATKQQIAGNVPLYSKPDTAPSSREPMNDKSSHLETTPERARQSQHSSPPAGRPSPAMAAPRGSPRQPKINRSPTALTTKPGPLEGVLRRPRTKSTTRIGKKGQSPLPTRSTTPPVPPRPTKMQVVNKP